MKADENCFPELQDRAVRGAKRDEAVRPRSAAASSLRIVLKNDRYESVQLREKVDTFSNENGFAEVEGVALRLCLEEIVARIVRHGFDGIDENEIDIQMLFQRNRRILTVRIVDDGKIFGLLSEYSLSNVDSQGRYQSLDDPGFNPVLRYADNFSYFRQGRYNYLILSRVISARPTPSADTPVA